MLTDYADNWIGGVFLFGEELNPGPNWSSEVGWLDFIGGTFGIRLIVL